MVWSCAGLCLVAVKARIWGWQGASFCGVNNAGAWCWDR